MRNQNRRRNPDLEAYRDWQSDRSDRGALQRYLISMDRGREILDDPEQIVILDELIGQDEALRPIYARVRPDYSNGETPFREERWRTLVNRYTGQQLDPQSVLILVEVGLRSGVPINDIYQILYNRNLINNTSYRIVISLNNENYNSLIYFSDGLNDIDINTLSIAHHLINSLRDQRNDNVRKFCAQVLGKIGTAASLAVPQLADSLENDENYEVRRYCAYALGKMGKSAVPAMPQLIDSLEYDQDAFVRLKCAKAIGQIGPSAASAVPYLIDSLKNECSSVKYECAIALGEIGPAAESAVPQLIDSLKRDHHNSTRRACAWSLGRIGPAAASSLPQLISSMNDYEYIVQEACRTAIEQITGEAPE